MRGLGVYPGYSPPWWRYKRKRLNQIGYVPKKTNYCRKSHDFWRDVYAYDWDKDLRDFQQEFHRKYPFRVSKSGRKFSRRFVPKFS